MKLDRSRRWFVMIAVLLTTACAVLSVSSITAAEVTVTRDLPDGPVYPGDDVEVSLTQIGFWSDVGEVIEFLPDGFSYVEGSAKDNNGDQVLLQYNEATNELTVQFSNVSTISYILEAGTTEQINAAIFSGNWTTLKGLDLGELSGTVTGDANLTAAEGTTPPPTLPPTVTPSNGGANGGGNGGGGGGTTPTPTTSSTPTTSPSGSPGVSPTPTSSPSASPSVTPTGTPTATPTGTPTGTATPSPAPTASPQPGIPGFAAGCAISGLLVVASVLLRLDRGKGRT
jgi:hypothetical protein